MDMEKIRKEIKKYLEDGCDIKEPVSEWMSETIKQLTEQHLTPSTDEGWKDLSELKDTGCYVFAIKDKDCIKYDVGEYDGKIVSTNHLDVFEKEYNYVSEHWTDCKILAFRPLPPLPKTEGSDTHTDTVSATDSATEGKE